MHFLNVLVPIVALLGTSAISAPLDIQKLQNSRSNSACRRSLDSTLNTLLAARADILNVATQTDKEKLETSNSIWALAKKHVAQSPGCSQIYRRSLDQTLEEILAARDFVPSNNYDDDEDYEKDDKQAAKLKVGWIDNAWERLKGVFKKNPKPAPAAPAAPAPPSPQGSWDPNPGQRMSTPDSAMAPLRVTWSNQ